jgi:hypothetical protein
VAPAASRPGLAGTTRRAALICRPPLAKRHEDRSFDARCLKATLLISRCLWIENAIDVSKVVASTRQFALGGLKKVASHDVAGGGLL